MFSIHGARAQSLQRQVKAYPTDLVRKFEARQTFSPRPLRGRHRPALGAKSDVKNRAEILHILGLAFQ